MSHHPRIKVPGVRCVCGSDTFTINKVVEGQLLFDCFDCGEHFVGINSENHTHLNVRKDKIE